MRAGASVARGIVLALVGIGIARAQDEGLPASSVPRPSHGAAAVASASTSVPTEVTTGFSVARDGLPFVNLGDFEGPGGNCLGMSLIALDNFFRRTDAERHGQTSSGPQAKAPIENPAEASTTDQALVSLVQEIGERIDDGDGPSSAIHERPLSDPSQIDQALAFMAKTGEPVIFTLSGKHDGHANVLFGYHDGKLQLYDPNYPGKVIEWPFDPVKGLGRHPLAHEDPFYAHLITTGATPLGRFSTAGALTEVRAACGEGAGVCTTDRYPTVKAKATQTAPGRVRVFGSVTRGPTHTYEGDRSPPPSRVWFSVDGKLVGSVRVHEGQFDVTFPSSVFAKGANDLQVIVTAEGMYAGSTREQVSPLGPATPPPTSNETGFIQALGDAAK